MSENNPVRILHVVTYMGRGGLETMIMNYYRHIDRSKIQFDFLVHREFEADYDREIQELGGRIYRLPKLNPFSSHYLHELDAFFAKYDEYKIVHCHLDCMAGIPLKYAKKYGVPVRIAHAHNSNQVKDGKYLLKLLFKKNITKNATNLFACGEEAGRWMFHSPHFQVLNNAINAKEYTYDPMLSKKVREGFGVDENEVLIGHVGRFTPQKNHRFIIDLFQLLVNENSNMKLMLVGDGELRTEIQQYVRDCHLVNNVVFTGVRSDVATLLQGMDLFLFPSLFEGLPVSIIEAQASGLPCIISDKVPIECKKTDLVKQISLEASKEVWVKEILKLVSIKRKNTYSEIKNSGFDIVSNAEWLSNFYLEKCKAGYNE